MGLIRSCYVSLAILTIPSLAISESVFYCAAELATGIAKRDGKWGTFPFKSERFTIKVDGDWKSIKIKGGGPLSANLRCMRPYPSSNTVDHIVACENGGYIFQTNTKNYRFIYALVSEFSYQNAENYSDDSTLYAGKCEKF